MAIGNPVTLTSNVASKTISVIATAGQTAFTVTGGYRINQLAVFRNGVRLVDSRDYEARDGATVTLLSAASNGDSLEFQVFDSFQVSDTINPYSTYQTINGNLNITGIITAATFSVTDLDVRNITGVAATFTGQVTYEDVTNVDSIGIITARSHVSIADSILHTGDTDTAIRFPTADTFTVETAGSERLRITSSGNVGVGTVAPTTRLHVLDTTKTSTTARDNTVARFLTNASNADCNIQLSNGIDHSAQLGIVGNGAEFYIAQDGVERLRITSAGDVGIGTEVPETPRGNKGLEVAGTTGAEIVATRFDDNLADGDFIGAFLFKNLDAGGTPNHFAGMYAKANGTAGSMDLHFSSDRAQYEADTSDLTIRGGDVGINSTSPGNKLSVDGDIGLYGSGTNHRNLYIYKDNVATAWFKYRGDNNVVVIGNNAGDRLTINPSGDLNVTGITTATQLFEGSTRVATSGKAIAMALIFG